MSGRGRGGRCGQSIHFSHREILRGGGEGGCCGAVPLGSGLFVFDRLPSVM